MDPSRAARIEALFHEALELSAPAREALLTEACAGDPELRREIDALIRASNGADEFFGRMADAASTLIADARADDDATGRIVGPFRIVRPLGAGGMGAVYHAERVDGGFRQEVALKLIRRGMDTDGIVARFRVERQILARLQHPSIARLLDGGVTDDGVPWFAMERVEGVPITEWCDRHAATVQERLALFATVCDAVQFAHANLVVHRDLKPDNILVREDGSPSLLDFGIAKLLDPDDASGDRTRADQVILTPRYAAPEQALGLPITTATDVYALGVVLFELLAGHPPDVPDAPPGSARSTGGRAPPRLSASAPARIRRQLSGDVDTICATAMRPEPERRYPSAGELADDVRRHLRGLPIGAHADSILYRTGKFTARHRAAVVLAVLALLFTLGFAGFHTVRLADERDRARIAAARATRVSTLLSDLFSMSDPAIARGRPITAREMLDRGARSIEQELRAEPEVQAELMSLIGHTYYGAGLYAEATAILLKALDVRRRSGASDSALAAVVDQLGIVRRVAGDYVAADTLAQQALALYRRRRGPDDLAVASALNSLAEARRTLGDFAAAESSYVQALTLRRRLLGPVAHRDVADNLNNLALLIASRGDHARAEAMHRESMAMRREVLGMDHPDYSNSLTNLAAVLESQGRYAEAESRYRESLGLRRRILGADNPRTLNTQKNLARLLHYAGEDAEARMLLRDALARMGPRLGPEHPWIADAMRSLALVHAATGAGDSAVAYGAAALAMNERLLGVDHPAALASAVDHAWVLAAAGDTAAAAALYRRAVDGQARVLGADHPHRIVGLERRAALLIGRGEAVEGQRLYDEARRIRALRTVHAPPR